MKPVARTPALPALLASLTLVAALAGCGKGPEQRLEGRYQELTALVRASRADSKKAVAAAEAWFKQQGPEIARYCEDRARLRTDDPEAARELAMTHIRVAKEAQAELDRLVEGWEPRDRVRLSALMLDLAQVCLDEGSKIEPLR